MASYPKPQPALPVPEMVQNLWVLQKELMEMYRCLDFFASAYSKCEAELNRMNHLIVRTRSDEDSGLAQIEVDLQRYLTSLQVDHDAWVKRIFYKRNYMLSIKDCVIDMGLGGYDFYKDWEPEQPSEIGPSEEEEEERERERLYQLNRPHVRLPPVEQQVDNDTDEEPADNDVIGVGEEDDENADY